MPEAKDDATTLDLFREPVAPPATVPKSRDRQYLKDYHAKWRQANQERLRQSGREYYHKVDKFRRKPRTPEQLARIAEQSRRLDELDPERIVRRRQRAKENAAARYKANRPKIVEQLRKWRTAHREHFREATRRYRHSKPCWNAVGVARARARKSGFEFDLTREWCDARQTTVCELTGIPFQRYEGCGHKAGPLSVSIDRIDNARGYLRDNCRFVLWAINRFKGDGDDETMLTIARALVAKADATKNGE